jgi:predicted permease
MTARLPEDARRLLRLGNVHRDVDEELSFHFEQTVADLVKTGMAEDAARAEANRRFGDRRQYHKELESMDRRTAATNRIAEKADALRHMIVQGTRSIVRSPGLTAGVVLAFALGIGANATMFGIIDRLLLRPPSHITQPDRLRRLFVESYNPFAATRLTDATVSYPDYVDMTRVKSFSAVAAGSGRTLTLGNGDEAHEVEAELVTGNFFQVLGTRPALGRFLDPSTDRIGGAQEAVLSYSLWQREFGGDASAIGRSVDFGYGPYTIVGVAPEGFTSVGLTKVDMWLPMRVAATPVLGDGWEPEPDGRTWQWLEMVGRLAPGVSVERAEAEATAVHRAARAKDIADGNWGRDPKIIAASIIEAKAPNAPSSARVAQLLAAVSLLVLLIACVNVANLLLARTIRQRREVAVRLALGISRRRLIGQIVLEGVMLAALGGAGALAVDHWGGGFVRRTLLPQIAWDDMPTDHSVLVIIVVLAILAGIVSALVPAYQVAKRDVADTIRTAAAGGITRTTSQTRSVLALAQTALSVILLVGAGLFVRSLHNARNLDLGFEPNGLLTASLRTNRGALSPAERQLISARALESVARIHGVTAVARSSTLPFTSRRTMSLRAEGVDSIHRPASGGPFMHGVSPGYFETMGVSILRGRGIEDTDVAGAPPVAVVGQEMADYLWKGQDAIGKCLYIGPKDKPQPCTRVVGIAEQASNIELTDGLMLQYYLPLAQGERASERPDYMLFRVSDESAATIAAIRHALLSLDPRIRYADITPYAERIEPMTRSWKLGATMFTIFGILALIVAAIGLYSVLAFDIAQRTRELGLRTALGATKGMLVRRVIGGAVRVTMVGIVIGGLGAWLLAPRMTALLFNTPPHDPAVLAGVAVTLVLVSIVAAAVPAWRATRVDPYIALRSD